MAKPNQHKAATDVTVASLSEPSQFEQAVQRYWKPAAAVAVVVTGVILYRQNQKASAADELNGSWSAISDATPGGGMQRFPIGDPATLAGVADELSDSVAGPWARWIEALNRREDDDFAGARAAIERLRADFADHELVAKKLEYAEGESRTAVESFLASLDAQEGWNEANTGIFENPAPPEDAPKVRIKTSAGDIVVQLYPNLAPTHCENFLKLCDEGYYNQTKFHRVMENFMIQGGDPNSKTDDKSSWGQGGPEEKVSPEPSVLKHHQGVLAAAKMPGKRDSSGSQFYIVTGDPGPHHLNGLHTVYGVVIEGLEVALGISTAEIEEGTQDRPAEPVVVESTTRE